MSHIHFISTYNCRKALLGFCNKRDKWTVHCWIYTTFSGPKPELAVMKLRHQRTRELMHSSCTGHWTRYLWHSNNRFQSHLHFLHRDCYEDPYLQCVLVINSERLVVLETHIWNQEWNSWAVRQWPFIKSSHNTGRTCLCIVRLQWVHFSPGESETQLFFCNKYLPGTFA